MVPCLDARGCRRSPLVRPHVTCDLRRGLELCSGRVVGLLRNIIFDAYLVNSGLAGRPSVEIRPYSAQPREHIARDGDVARVRRGICRQRASLIIV